ncbi:hypothetical protein C0993_005654 [Termitomyces sp. T159_Od127]|nr:hypothetical protein C0993_005654 [Termitomyces sp. T159_Od127]
MLASSWARKRKSSRPSFFLLPRVIFNARHLADVLSSHSQRTLICPASSFLANDIPCSLVSTGTLAAAYVNGLQSEGVSATIKHLVANDQEHERTAADSVVSTRALREIYLYPFMIAQRDAKPGAFMTSYGRIEGVHCSENKKLLTGILRNEWGFEGIVISDWHGTYGADQPINAGLDLEMPGPPRWRTPHILLQCLSSQKLLPKTLDERVTTLLEFVQKQTRRNPETVYGDGVERSRDTPEGRQFCRNLAANGIVLLKNNNKLLPLDTCRVKRLAIIGPNAKERIISGGGSAALKAIYVVTPFDGVTAGAPEGLSVEYEVGCYDDPLINLIILAHKYLPTLEENLVTPTGEPGWLCTFYSHNEDGSLSDPVANFVLRDTRIKLNDFLPAGLTREWTIRLEGKLTIHRSVLFELGLTVAGRAKLWIDGELTIDNWTKQTPGDFFYGQGTIEEKATIGVTAGVPLAVLVEYTNTPPPDGDDENGEGRLSQPALMRGVRLGGCDKIDPEEAIQTAVSLAARSDAVLYVGGLSPEWESEGFDRPTLHMPGLQDELIHRLAEANPNTIVVVQAGSAVAMPWINSVAGLLQAWYLGNESGNAIADVLYGKINPGGRLPLTLPVRAEDIPAYLNDKSENGKIHYREDLFVGYKYYQARKIKPLFPFGFGLSYTTFSFSLLSVNGTITSGENVALEINVTVKNVGSMTGSEVIQVYASYPDIGTTTPRLQLKGFAKAKDIAPGESLAVNIKLNKYAVSFWDTGRNAWHASAGQYVFHLGPSSVNLPLRFTYDLQKSFSCLIRVINCISLHDPVLALMSVDYSDSPVGPRLWKTDFRRGDPRSLTSLPELLSCLSALQSEEAEHSRSLTELLNSRKPILLSLKRLNNLIPQVDTLLADTALLSSNVAITAKTAERVGGRVRSLDEEMGHVREAGDRVGQVMELKASLADLQSSIDSQDWEAATRHCARAMSLPAEVISGQFAEVTVPTSESHLPPMQTLEQARQNLLVLFRKNFEQASRLRDSTATSRFFKLFPVIGWEDEGLEAYASFVVDLVRVRAPTSSKTSSPLHYIAALTTLFESIAKIVDQHQLIVEKYYGPGKMRHVVKRLLSECDRVVKCIIEGWEEERSLKRKVWQYLWYSMVVFDYPPKLSDVTNNPPNYVPGPAIRRPTSSSPDETKVDQREIDKVLSELAGMIGRWSLFRKFMVDSLQDEGSQDVDSDKPRGASTPAITYIDSTESRHLFGSLTTTYYIPLEVWYIRTSIDKAHRLSNVDVSQLPSSTTTPDDVFYILKIVISRLLSTGDVKGIEIVFDQLRNIMEQDYVGVIRKKLDDVYRHVGSSGPTSWGEKGEKENRVAFILGIEQMFNQLMRPKMRTFITDIYKDVSYILDEDAYSVAEHQDYVRKRFMKAWEGFVDGSKALARHCFLLR